MPVGAPFWRHGQFDFVKVTRLTCTRARGTIRDALDHGVVRADRHITLGSSNRRGFFTIARGGPGGHGFRPEPVRNGQ